MGHGAQGQVTRHGMKSFVNSFFQQGNAHLRRKKEGWEGKLWSQYQCNIYTAMIPSIFRVNCVFLFFRSTTTCSVSFFPLPLSPLSFSFRSCAQYTGRGRGRREGGGRDGEKKMAPVVLTFRVYAREG